MSWMDREAHAEPRSYNGGDDPAAVYTIGRYEVTVYGATPQNPARVTYRSNRYNKTEPRATLPNMAIDDGEIRIPITDLVDEVLARVTPAGLCEAMWSEKSVRDAFCDALCRRYNEVGVVDEDRRKVIAGIKDAIHNKACDELLTAMSLIEYEVARGAHFYDQVYRINTELQRLDVRDAHGVPWRINLNDKIVTVGGQAWTEAREHWRQEIIKRFPAPPAAEVPRNDIL